MCLPNMYPICTLGVGMCAMCQLCAESVLVLGWGGVTGLWKRVRTRPDPRNLSPLGLSHS